jgi:hypothetical protein
MRTFSFLKQRPDEDIPPPFVFLGGTVNSNWRDKLKELLTIAVFDPIVANWTPECVEEENTAKALAAVSLYVITPKHTGFYAIAELTHASFANDDHKVVVCFLDEDAGITFTKAQQDSNRAITDLISLGKNCTVLVSLEQVAEYLNKLPQLNQ